MKNSIITIPLALGLIGCGEDSSKSQKITAPDLRPPVEESIPQTMLNGRTETSLGLEALTTCPTDNSTDPCGEYASLAEQAQCQVKNRFFCGGPTDMLTILDDADRRMAEIEERSTIEEEQKIPCFEADAQDASSELVFPGNQTFETHLNCKDNTIGLSFGNKDDSWYIREGKATEPTEEAGAAGAHVFKITGENQVSGYAWTATPDGTYEFTTLMLQIYADRSAGTLEVTGGGVGTGFCSFHYRSDADYIYILSNIAGTGVTCDSDGNGSTDSSDWVETCLAASSLDSSDVTNCASLKSGRTLTTLGRAESQGPDSDTYEGTASIPSGNSLETFELKDYLLSLYEAAGDVSDDIPDFAIE